MLTKRQNFLECIHGGNPDRYVNQYEYLQMLRPPSTSDLSHMASDGYLINEWGVYQTTVPGQPGMFPMHDMEHRVVKDIADYKQYIKYPRKITSEEWEKAAEQAEKIDRNEVFCTLAIFPGIFENLHHLCEITETLAAFYEEPEAVKDILKLLTQRELEFAEGACKYIKPDAMFHHDDWGTKTSTFLAPEMFEEFLLEPYKEVYKYYKDHGVEVIVHHSDSFGETLVPYMIEIGIDVWQGTLRETNNIPALVDKYGDQIAFMGGIETALIDLPDWTPEKVEAEVNLALDTINRKKSFIPCLTSGMDSSCYPGVYDEVSKIIAKRSEIDFK